MRLIDADALHIYVADVTLSEGITWLEAEIVHDFLDNAPTIEAEPKRGKWIAKKRGHGLDCSECGYELWTYGSRNYCPHCGAKMDTE